MYRARPSIPRIAFRTRRPGECWTQVRCAASSRDSKGRKGQTPHWTAEKLETSEEFPLTQALSKTIHPALEPTKKPRKQGAPVHLHRIPVGINVRTQIVSPRLCGTSSPGATMLFALGGC
ncbi:hypothetical protein P153DRAFT_225878 [Dothidotthia symphoricarpi CBS 119687]|uniref:Uncharacterized protein n=1 Tax=Dothidotthia symphoricarpi CBS 119687 TaxID=1392245 RepID=A0A6A6AHF1_9PLEO|nr:uncharacterized protein P153DRAFT_225878 [Dothidotthia symphoricarpi CBS 119687]KAF2129871.1 hypothetical protein P153DRAFT_225878 [Dothidotthia symphoricarpi CBS 119687]